jgi:hypothetical protein
VKGNCVPGRQIYRASTQAVGVLAEAGPRRICGARQMQITFNLRSRSLGQQVKLSPVGTRLQSQGVRDVSHYQMLKVYVGPRGIYGAQASVSSWTVLGPHPAQRLVIKTEQSCYYKACLREPSSTRRFALLQSCDASAACRGFVEQNVGEPARDFA